jgi:4'-phosphopantetheinyl transferase
MPSDLIEPSGSEGLAAGVVHVCRLGLDVPDDVLVRLGRWLAPDEAARAERFVFGVHRRRFTAARAVLRGLLGRQLRTAPPALRFAYGENGKPRLAEPGHALHFNVSHSQDQALIALASDRELGVDVEAVRASVDHAAIARRFFAPGELEALLAVPEPARGEAFFDVWTRKEAYLKLHGGGLGVPLDSFEVSLDDAPRLLRDARDQAAPARVTLATPSLPAGFRGAVAFAGEARLLTLVLDPREILQSADAVL